MAATASEISLAGCVFLRAWGGFRNGQDEGEGPEEDEKEMVVENAKGLEVCGEYGMFE